MDVHFEANKQSLRAVIPQFVHRIFTSRVAKKEKRCLSGRRPDRRYENKKKYRKLGRGMGGKGRGEVNDSTNGAARKLNEMTRVIRTKT